MEREEFDKVIENFIHFRLIEGHTVEEAKAKFQNSVNDMHHKQIEIIMFYDYLIQTNPWILENIISKKDTKKQEELLWFMMTTWMFRAELHLKMVIPFPDPVNKTIN